MTKQAIAVPAPATKEEIKRAARLAAHVYQGHTASEWRAHAEGLRRLEDDNGGEPDYSDADTARMIADALEEMDDELDERSEGGAPEK